MKFQYHIGVFIGRFQPFHKGHLHNIQKALTICQRIVILIGSSQRAPSIQNPFSYQQRRAMMQADLNNIGIDLKRIILAPLTDWYYNLEAWRDEVATTVQAYCQQGETVALIGHNKDASTFYLSLFDHWSYVAVDNYYQLNARQWRDIYFGQQQIDPHFLVCPTEADSSYYWLEDFMQTDLYQSLRQEYQAVAEYKAAWQYAPYPPVFVTLDACVVINQHILLIQRKNQPAKQLWALPGGFLDQDERIQSGIKRELREETQIDISDDWLNKNHCLTTVYDHPDRSVRGRTITHVSVFQGQLETLPTISPSDDAMSAQWIPCHVIVNDMATQMAEDHYQILRCLIKSGQIQTNTSDV